MKKEKLYSFNSPKTLAKEYLRKHIHNRQSLGLPRERVFNLSDPSDRERLEETFKELSPETQEKLKNNYEKQTIDNVIETIANFEMPLLIADKSIALSKEINKFSLSLIKTISADIKAIDALLKSPLIDEPEKKALQRQKEIHEAFKKAFKQKETDEAELSSLYDVMLDPFGGLGHALQHGEDEKWYKDYILSCLLLVVKQQKGRPSKIFWKALQIIIYECLTRNEPKTVSHNVQWAKELTATVINESYKRWRNMPNYPQGTIGHAATLICNEYGRYILPELTVKDIDNALHSTA